MLFLTIFSFSISYCQSIPYPYDLDDKIPYAKNNDTYANSIKKGTVFLDNDIFLLSNNRENILIMQTDGNLVLYKKGKAVWNTETYKRKKGTTQMHFQEDGNLVIYETIQNGKIGKALWSSQSYNQEGSYLIVQEDGNLVIYTDNNKAIWNTGTWNY